MFSARVALALVLTVPLLAVLVVATPGRGVYRLTQRWARLMVMLCGCRPHVTGLSNITADGVVMVANHSSFLDSVILLASIPGEYRFIANHIAASRPLLGTIIRKSGHLVVDRRSLRSRAACARAMVRSLESGVSLMSYPEGTRSQGGLLPFRLGPFRLAVKTSRAVVPIAVHGTHRMLPRTGRLLERVPLSVQVLAPIPVDGAVNENSAQVRDGAYAAIAAALDEPPQT